ncbi:sugar phosphate isomerase/epimerase family protein [Salinicola acroporae]|nr:sugar phosphate isomerase/epimerase [Salinicola acroporae]
MAMGVCTWTLGIDDLELLMDKVLELGFDGVQVDELWEHVSPAVIRGSLARRGLAPMVVDARRIGPQAGEAPDVARGVDAYRQVIDRAAELEAPVVTLSMLPLWIRGRATPSNALAAACRELADYAAEREIRLVHDVVNHDETPMIHTLDQANRLVGEVARANFGLMLDSYHLHFEAVDPVAAIESSGDALAVYQVSDSTRGGIGSGAVDFEAQFDALLRIGFDGPVILECLPPMHDPVSPVSSEGNRRILEDELSRSREIWRGYSSSRR